MEKFELLPSLNPEFDKPNNISRRDFLKRAALVAGAAVLYPSELFDEKEHGNKQEGGKSLENIENATETIRDLNDIFRNKYQKNQPPKEKEFADDLEGEILKSALKVKFENFKERANIKYKIRLIFQFFLEEQALGENYFLNIDYLKSGGELLIKVDDIDYKNPKQDCAIAQVIPEKYVQDEQIPIHIIHSKNFQSNGFTRSFAENYGSEEKFYNSFIFINETKISERENDIYGIIPNKKPYLGHGKSDAIDATIAHELVHYHMNKTMQYMYEDKDWTNFDPSIDFKITSSEQPERFLAEFANFLTDKRKIAELLFATLSNMDISFDLQKNNFAIKAKLPTYDFAYQMFYNQVESRLREKGIYVGKIITDILAKNIGLNLDELRIHSAYITLDNKNILPIVKEILGYLNEDDIIKIEKNLSEIKNAIINKIVGAE